MADNDGTKAGLAMALAVSGDDEPEQLDLVAAAGGDRAPADVQRGPGRPAGSRNKRTADLVELLRRKHGKGPLELIFERMMMDPAELAKTLHISAKDAWLEQGRLAVAALPYVEQKMPIAVDLTEKKTFILEISMGGGKAGGAGGAYTIEGHYAPPEKTEENQDDSEGET